MPKSSYKDALLNRLPKDCSAVSNASLMTQLGWKRDKFYKYRNKLKDAGVVVISLGQGGKTALKQKEEAVFSVFGPFDLIVKAGHADSNYHFSIERPCSRGTQFWKRHGKIDSQKCLKGVYVYCLKNRRRLTPIYVGLANGEKGFAQECFTHDKMNMVLRTWSREQKSKPCVFFLRAPKILFRKGFAKRREAALQEVETFLIQLGLLRNPELQNDRKTKSSYQGNSLVKLLEEPPEWVIPGIVKKGSGRGTSSGAVLSLRKCFGLKS